MEGNTEVAVLKQENILKQTGWNSSTNRVLLGLNPSDCSSLDHSLQPQCVTLSALILKMDKMTVMSYAQQKNVKLVEQQLLKKNNITVFSTSVCLI